MRRDELESRVLRAMQKGHWKQDLFEEFCVEYTRARNRLHGEAVAAASAARRGLDEIGRKLAEADEWIFSGRWRQASAFRYSSTKAISQIVSGRFATAGDRGAWLFIA
jgi:hypothetical protein